MSDRAGPGGRNPSSTLPPHAPDAPDAGGRDGGPRAHIASTYPALAGLILIWSANFSIAKFALSDFAPLAFNGVRFLLASAFIYVFVRVQLGGGFHIERRHWPRLLWLGILGNVVYQICFIYGLDWTLAGNSSLMLAMSPVFITLLSVAFRQEEVGGLAWLGVAASFVGVALVVWGGTRAVGFASDTVRGDLTTLGASLAWSTYTVGGSPLVRRYGALPVTAITMWIGAVGLALVSIPSFLMQDWSAVRPSAWAALGYSGIFAIGVAYLIWYYSVRRIGSTRTGIYSNAIPIVAVLIAWLMLGEQPTWLQLLGAVGVVGGAVLARIGKVAGVGERVATEQPRT